MNERKTEHPILFSTPMVQAILEGRKTMTRRILKVNGCKKFIPDSRSWNKEDIMSWTANGATCPYGQVGDKLWVRETFRVPNPYGVPRYLYKSDWEKYNTGISYEWKPSIYMPKAAARIWLEITDIRVERLQDITEEDAKAEGFESLYCKPTFDGDPFGGTVPASYYFKETFRKLAKSNDIMLNPWVWVVEFKRITHNS